MLAVLTSSSATFEAIREAIAWSETYSFAYAWMTSDDGRSDAWHALDDDKLERGVLGVSFVGTDPYVLEWFSTEHPGKVRIADPDGGATFHPKLLIARRGRHRRAILGSSNFTAGGLGHNTELNVLLSGDAEDAALAKLDRTLAWYWRTAADLTSEYVAQYRASFRRRSAPTHAPVPAQPRRRRIHAASDLEVDWATYRQMLYDAPLGHWVWSEEDDTWVGEARRARDLLRGVDSFAELDYPDARYVAGFGPNVGYFGATRANGLFKKYVRTKPDAIARLIDPVPLEGPVSDEIVRDVFHAAEDLERVGIGCVSRLLCIKRPDAFYSVNSANRRRLAELFGKAPTSVDEYLDILHRVRALPWARSKRPTDSIEGEIWDARIGLLDVVTYDP